MNSEQEELYIRYWEANREREGKLVTQLLFGIPIGLLFSVPVFVILISAKIWYKRADMAANSSLSPGLLITAVGLIASFVAVIYKRHQWDMKEQQYLEFKAKAENRAKNEVEPREGVIIQGNRNIQGNISIQGNSRNTDNSGEIDDVKSQP